MEVGLDPVMRAWVDAGVILSKDPGQKVSCPECGKGYLVCIDEPAEEKGKTDRYMICSDCKKWNIVTINILPE